MHSFFETRCRLQTTYMDVTIFDYDSLLFSSSSQKFLSGQNYICLFVCLLTYLLACLFVALLRCLSPVQHYTKAVKHVIDRQLL